MNQKSNENSAAQLRELAVAYAGKVPEYCRQIESMWLKAGIPGAPGEVIDSLILQCHKLSGSAASYGLVEISALATSIEKAAKVLRIGGQSDDSASETDTGKLIEKLVQLGTMVTPDQLADTAAGESKANSDRNVEPLIYIVDDDPEQGQRLALQLAPHGYRTESFTQLDDLREAILTRSPEAIVADIIFPEGENAGIEAMAALRHAGRESLPVIFISRRSDAEARLAALRAGGRGYFTKPISLPSLAAKLHELTDKVDDQPYRIMVVDDDASTNMLHATILNKAGCMVSSITDPLKTMEEAFEFRPEMVFLDLYMPGADGLEIAMMLRQEESFMDVPIVFLSGEEDEEVKARAIKEGAASFLNKPVSANNLVEVASSRARQYRVRAVKARYFGRIDPVTGLFTRDYLFTHLNQFCNETSKLPGLPALLMVEIDGYAYLLRTIGEDHIRLLRARVAHQIRSCLGSQDIAASYTDNSFLILSRQQDLQRLERFADIIHQAITAQPTEIMDHSFKLSASIGVSRVAGNDHNKDMSQASLACSLAQNEGGNQVRYHSDLRQEALQGEQVRQLRLQIKGAIKEKRILLAYSPVVGITVDTSERYTILMRLQDDKGKVMYPGQFLPVAQKYNLMPGLDRWTVLTALQALAEREAGESETMFYLKLSQPTILDKEFVPWLKKLLNSLSLNGSSCIFEIKEDDLAGNLEQVQDFTKGLRELNCGVSIERFGRSKDSFNVLHLLHPDYLRLDLTLLHNLSSDKEKQTTIKEICSRAHEEGSKVLTAFTQDSQTLSLFWGMGVDYIQGDFLDQPAASKKKQEESRPV